MAKKHEHLMNIWWTNTCPCL